MLQVGRRTNTHTNTRWNWLQTWNWNIVYNYLQLILLALNNINCMSIMFLFLVIVFILAVHRFLQFCQFLYRQYLLYNKIKNLPGPDIKLPFFGNLDFMSEIVRTTKDPNQLSKVFYDRIFELCDKYGNTEHGLIRLWFGPFVPFIIISNPRTAQVSLHFRSLDVLVSSLLI